MKRFIRYLYEYEQKKRIRNIGFLKVESGDEETIVHMQGKGFHINGDRKLVLYLFYEENDKLIVIRQGEIELTTPVMNWHFKYTANDVGVPENYLKIKGVLVQTASGRRIVATWDDRAIDVSRMEEFESVPEVVVPVDQEAEKVGPMDSKTEEIGPQIREEGLKIKKICRKIQRQDIAKLPRCEWKLANNQFLLHGYNNYHHLLLIEKENDLKLGVPGIYHIKEAQCAEMFGFDEFLSMEELDVSLEPEEFHQDESFGYWCRPVRRYKGD